MRIILLLIIISCSLYGSAQNKIKPDELNEDFEYLIKELKSQHQGLYQYVNINQTDKKIDSIRETLQIPQTQMEFYEKLRYTIGLTNEGHSSIDLPKWTMVKLGISKSFLPLAVKLCDKDLIITQNFGKDINNLTKGVKLISINDKKINEILDRFYPLIPTDGFNETSKHEWIGGLNFSLLYRLVYGKEKRLKLQIQEFGSDEIQTVFIPAIRFTRFKSKNAKFESKKFDYEEFKFEKVNDGYFGGTMPLISVKQCHFKR